MPTPSSAVRKIVIIFLALQSFQFHISEIETEEFPLRGLD